MASRAKLLLLSVLVAFLLLSCGGQQSPEEEIRAYFVAIEKHMEERNTGRLKKYISTAYSDRYNNTRQDLSRIAAGYLLRQPAIHLNHHIVAMEINESHNEANVTIDVLVSREPLAENDLRVLQGDFHRFAVILVKEDDWLLHSLVWQRLTGEDFMFSREGSPPAAE